MKLDVGCGNFPTDDVNCDLYRVDIGGGYRSKAGFFRLDINAKLKPEILADAQYLPFRNNTINEIYCSHILEHLQNPRLTIREIARILKSKGTATIIVPNIRFPWTIYLRYKYGGMRSPFEKHRWKITQTSLKKIINDSGLVASELQPLDGHEMHWGIEWILFATKFQFITKIILFAKRQIKWLDKIICIINKSFYKRLDNPPELKIHTIKLLTDRSLNKNLSLR